MKFTIDRKALARMLRVLGTGRGKTCHGALLRLAAQDGQVVFEAGSEAAGCPATVFEEGVCFFRPSQFLPLVRTYASEAKLTMEVTPEGIQIGSTKISRGLWEISLFQNPATAPATLAFIVPKVADIRDGQGELDFGAR